MPTLDEHLRLWQAQGVGPEDVALGERTCGVWWPREVHVGSVPPSFNEQQVERGRPENVQFGPADAWYALWGDGEWQYEVDKDYQALSELDELAANWKRSGSQPQCLALGPDGSWFCSWGGRDVVYAFENGQNFPGLAQEIDKWSKRGVFIQTLELGGEGAWFARWSNNECTYEPQTSGFHSDDHDQYGGLVRVRLGVGGAYFAQWGNGEYAWEGLEEY